MLWCRAAGGECGALTHPGQPAKTVDPHTHCLFVCYVVCAFVKPQMTAFSEMICGGFSITVTRHENKQCKEGFSVPIWLASGDGGVVV